MIYYIIIYISLQYFINLTIVIYTGLNLLALTTLYNSSLSSEICERYSDVNNDE